MIISTTARAVCATTWFVERTKRAHFLSGEADEIARLGTINYPGNHATSHYHAIRVDGASKHCNTLKEATDFCHENV